jgi:iron complex outermembrane recepter protein
MRGPRMRRSLSIRLALAASALTSLLSMPALAQDAQGAESGSASDIIVTARRTEERLQDVPISITVYTQQQLTDRNIASSVDLAKYTPSLSVNTRFGPDKASFILRGFSADMLTAPSVAVYVADVVAPRIQSNIQSGNGAGAGIMYDLQNVQVLKGPQGTLFGRNTTGGAILIVPKKPTKTLEGYAEGTVTNFNGWRIQGALNIPLSDTIRARISADRYTRDGYLRNRKDLGGVGPDDFNDINYIAVRGSLVIDLTPDLENYTIVSFVRSSTHGTMGRLAVANQAIPASLGGLKPLVFAQYTAFQNAGFYDVANSVANPFNKQKTFQVINTTTWKSSDSLTIKNIASFSRAQELYAQNIAGDAHAFPVTETYPGPDGQQGNQRTFTEELQFQGHFGDKLTWQAGGYLEMSDPVGQQSQFALGQGHCADIYTLSNCTLLATTIPNVGTFGIGSIGVSRNNYKFRNYALYAQGTYDFTDQLSLTAGFRYTWDRQYSHSHNFTIRPLQANIGVVTVSGLPASTINGLTNATFTCTPPVTGSGTYSEIFNKCDLFYNVKSAKPTWLIGLDYKPTEDLLIYAKYARGYRAGGINPQINDATGDSAKWKPERIDDFELGIKATFRGKIRGTLNINGFYNNFQGQQTSLFVPQCTVAGQGVNVCTQPVASGAQLIVNSGTSHIKGVEVDASFDLFEGFRFDAAYAYLDAQLVRVGPPTACNNASYVCSAGTAQPLGVLTYAPKNRVTVTGTYTFPLDPSVGRVSISATFTHTDQQRNSYAGKSFFDAGLIPFDPSLLPATNLLNLNLNWNDVAGKGIDLGLFATNVTKQNYWTANAGLLSSTGGDSIFLGEPRVFGARVRVHFGD